MTSQPLNRPVDVLRWIRNTPAENGWKAKERDAVANAVAELIESSGRVLVHRVGDLPNLGYIRDNDQSRKDIAAFVAALAAVKGQP